MNGFHFEASEEEFADMVLAVAEGRMTKAEATIFIRRCSIAE